MDPGIKVGDLAAECLGDLLSRLPRCSYCHVRAGIAANVERFPLCEKCLLWAPLPPQTLVWDIRASIAKLRSVLHALGYEAPQEPSP